MQKLDMTNIELIHGGSALDIDKNKLESFQRDLREQCNIIKDNISSLEKGESKMAKEAVNHPSHYNRENSTECIEEMILVFGKEAVKNFCLCNVWKYRYRAADKNGVEDLAKSDWYFNKYKELCKDDIMKGTLTIKQDKIIRNPIDINDGDSIINPIVTYNTPAITPVNTYTANIVKNDNTVSLDEFN